MLAELQTLEISWERADERYVGIDVHPEAEYQAVCDQLFKWEQEGLLEYETCEARVSGSFDDKVNEDDDSD